MVLTSILARRTADDRARAVRSERAAYGTALLKLAQDLTGRLGRGFSERNLEQMGAFYLAWPNTGRYVALAPWSSGVAGFAVTAGTIR